MDTLKSGIQENAGVKIKVYLEASKSGLATDCAACLEAHFANELFFIAQCYPQLAEALALYMAELSQMASQFPSVSYYLLLQVCQFIQMAQQTTEACS